MLSKKERWISFDRDRGRYRVEMRVSRNRSVTKRLQTLDGARAYVDELLLQRQQNNMLHHARRKRRGQKKKQRGERGKAAFSVVHGACTVDLS